MGLIITLILLGLLLIFAEILIIPGVGVAGILGLLMMGGSCAYAFWEFGVITGAIVIGVNALMLVVFTVWILRAKTWKKLTLDTNINSKTNVLERELNVGDEGATVTRLAPMGTAVFNGVSVEVTALTGIIDSGTHVRIVSIDGNKIFVDTIKAQSEDAE